MQTTSASSSSFICSKHN